MTTLESDIRTFLTEIGQTEQTTTPKQLVEQLAEHLPNVEIKPFLIEKLYLGSYSKTQKRFIQQCIQELA